MSVELITSEIEHYFVVGVILTCFLVGFIVKNYTKIDNKYIPAIMMITGIISNIAICMNDNLSITYSAIISGGISGLASSGFYDLLKKSIGISVRSDQPNTTNDDKKDIPKG